MYINLSHWNSSVFCLIVLIAVCTRNVAAGIVLSLLLCIYICHLIACSLAACFWRNKDAYFLIIILYYAI